MDYIAKAWEHKMPKGLPVMVPMMPIVDDSSIWDRIKFIWASTPYVLAKDFIYVRNNGVHITVPAGFCTDFGSTPRILWPFGLEPTGILLTCSLIHDFGYRHDFYLGVLGTKIYEGLGKDFHDRLFKEIFEEVNGIKVMPSLSYLGLRYFGWFAWKSNEKYRNGNLALTGEYDKIYKAQNFRFSSGG